ncbi:hypothetical protein LR003_01845 [candidate division NPL-UPA2 bacterium]|nr:hypothetical protein [candidate division NPL-UPA2 bacterium]
MNEVVLITVLLALLILTGFLIAVLVEFRKITKKLDNFLDTTEKDIVPSIVEFRGTFENLKFITRDILHITKNMKRLSEALSVTAENISSFAMKISSMDKEVDTAISALKEGITTASEAFIGNINQKEEQDNSGQEEGIMTP